MSRDSTLSVDMKPLPKEPDDERKKKQRTLKGWYDFVVTVCVIITILLSIHRMVIQFALRKVHKIFKSHTTVAPRYNAVVGMHKMEPHFK